MSEDKVIVEPMVPGDAPIPADIEVFLGILNELNISHVVQEDNTVVLTFRRIRFDMNGKRVG